jgi:hypothetical protein
MPRICRSESDLTRPRHRRGMGPEWERNGMCELASAVHRRHVGEMHAFGNVGEWQGHGRFVTGSRQGNDVGTAWYV